MRLTTSPPSCAECHENVGVVYLLEPSGPHRACYGTPLLYIYLLVCIIITYDLLALSAYNPALLITSVDRSLFAVIVLKLSL